MIMSSLPINQIICSDCLEIMKHFPNDCIDLTVTSPPYDNLRTYKGYEFNFEEIANQLYRITKLGGVVVWVVGDATIKGSETGTSFRQALGFMDIGFRLHDTMIYLKDHLAFPDSNRYYQGFEYMFVFSKSRPKSVNRLSDRYNKSVGRGMKGTTERTKEGITRARVDTGKIIEEYGIRFNYWFISNPYRGIHTQNHPATFPLELANDHIYSWSNDGDIVLDPFIGSGTTALAAKKLNRNYIGIDISQEYCDLARERVLT